MRRENPKEGCLLSGEAIMADGCGLGWKMEHETESPGKLVGR